MASVIVIGAGLSGLAAAAHLTRDGHEVTVLERASTPGGRAAFFDAEGYHIDLGPTVLTMTDLLADAFHATGATMEDYLEIAPVDPMYRATFSDGSVLRVLHGRDAMTEEIRSVCGNVDARAFGRFCDWLEQLYNVELPHFIDANFNSPLDLMRTPAALISLLRLGGLQRLSRKVAEFFADERLQRVFSFQSMYAGLAPYEALAVYAVITYMDSVRGVSFPKGGMGRIGVALAEACEKAGVQFQYDTNVERILRTPSGAVSGVRLASGENVAAEIVVCSADLPVAYRELLGTEPPLVARRGRYSPSCVVWGAGVRGALPEHTAHHNIFFGDQWNDAFRALLRDGTRMPDPSILVTVPTLGDPTLAPPGGHVLYVLEPVPNLSGRIDWTRQRDSIKADIEARVGALGFPTEVVTERFIDPLDWESQGMAMGTPFALAHRFFQSGPFRPNNVTRKVPGLVFTGSGTVPGVGVPMVLISGKLAAQRVAQYAGMR
ncbi:MAG: phytoene desaturase family protein [Acidimicrobiia bacterium]